MMRRQRAFHARLWILLALMIAGLFAAALITRADVQGAQDNLRAEGN